VKDGTKAHAYKVNALGDINHMRGGYCCEKWRRSEIIFAIERTMQSMDNAISRPFLGQVQIFFYSAAPDRFNFYTLVIESL
jgi:hypothetical protein